MNEDLAHVFNHWWSPIALYYHLSLDNGSELLFVSHKFFFPDFSDLNTRNYNTSHRMDLTLFGAFNIAQTLTVGSPSPLVSFTTFTLLQSVNKQAECEGCCVCMGWQTVYLAANKLFKQLQKNPHTHTHTIPLTCLPPLQCEQRRKWQQVEWVAANANHFNVNLAFRKRVPLA